MASKKSQKAFKPLYEGEKPKIVVNLESAFKNALWDADKPFDINDNDMHLLFDAINDGLFQNKLGRDIPRFTLKAELIPSGPRRYRGMEHASGRLQAMFSAAVKSKIKICRRLHNGKERLLRDSGRKERRDHRGNYSCV